MNWSLILTSMLPEHLLLLGMLAILGLEIKSGRSRDGFGFAVLFVAAAAVAALWLYATGFTGAPFLHLDCLYLDPAARGLRLGPALLDAAVCRARALGCEQLQWQTPVWNDGAIRFYDRLGATRLAKQRYTLACAEWAETPLGPRC